MKKFHQKEHYPKGDCFRTCVASILEVEKLEDVPNFMMDGEERFDDHFYPWLDKMGYMYISYEIHNSVVFGRNFYNQLCILGAKNKKTGIRHCVVGSVWQDSNKIYYGIEHDPIKGADPEDLEINIAGFIVKRLDI